MTLEPKQKWERSLCTVLYILNYLLLKMPARWLQNDRADEDISWVSSCLQSQTNVPFDLNTPVTRTTKDETLRLGCYATFHISRILWSFSTVNSLLDTTKSAVFKEFFKSFRLFLWKFQLPEKPREKPAILFSFSGHLWRTDPGALYQYSVHWEVPSQDTPLLDWST